MSLTRHATTLTPRDLVRSGAPPELLWAMQQQQLRLLQLRQCESQALFDEVQRHEAQLRNQCHNRSRQALHQACARYDYEQLRELAHELRLQQLRGQS